MRNYTLLKSYNMSILTKFYEVNAGPPPPPRFFLSYIYMYIGLFILNKKPLIDSHSLTIS